MICIMCLFVSITYDEINDSEGLRMTNGAIFDFLRNINKYSSQRRDPFLCYTNPYQQRTYTEGRK